MRMIVSIHKTENMSVKIHDHEHDENHTFVALNIHCEDGTVSYFFNTLEEAVDFKILVNNAIHQAYKDRPE